MTTKLGSFRTMMLLALCSVPATPESHALAQASWWGDFVREMEGIGCINIRQSADGEFEFDCPADNVEKAKAIIARYKVRS